ncbi:hypothetical protein VNO77_16028 [Canavalia gladiata]|uniref:Uncharacterized protein n=1 Tax=Canavalia gladiata TaxID=3824 RepID=A0AAN9QRN4_CANGL
MRNFSCFAVITWFQEFSQTEKKGTQPRFEFELNKGGSDSPFLRQESKKLTKAASQHLCIGSQGNFTQTLRHLARTQLFTQCLVQLLKTSSLPCYREEEEEETKAESRQVDKPYKKMTVLERKERERDMFVFVYTCVESCNFNYNDHWLTQQLREGNSSQDNLISLSVEPHT